MKVTRGVQVPPSLEPVGEVLLSLVEATRAEMAKAAARRTGLVKRGRNRALRPGPDTPAWLALVEAVRPHLRRRGTKAHLARELEVPRQRVHDFFVAQSAMPDAERVLRLLVWLSQQRPVR